MNKINLRLQKYTKEKISLAGVLSVTVKLNNQLKCSLVWSRLVTSVETTLERNQARLTNRLSLNPTKTVFSHKKLK